MYWKGPNAPGPTSDFGTRSEDLHPLTHGRVAGRPAGWLLLGLLVLAAGPVAADQAVDAPLALALAGDTVRRGPALTPYDAPFAEEQLRFPRVQTARIHTRFGIKRLFRERGLSYPAAEIYLRVFKRERQLELWVKPVASETFALLRTYPICALAGVFGPKRRQGDWQTPEGYYEIDHFNPWSQYHLSLHMNYPNRSDRLRSQGGSLGGEIFIHGGCQTEGCIALTDEAIEELYWLSVEARAAGQQRIPVHIFPVRLTDDEIALIGTHFDAEPELQRFWSNLKPGYDYFEATRRLPRVTIDGRGHYVIEGATGLATDAPVLGKPIVVEEERRDRAQEAPVAPPTPRRTGPQVMGTPLDPGTMEPLPAIEESGGPVESESAEVSPATAGVPDAIAAAARPGDGSDAGPPTATAAGRPMQGPPRLASAHAAQLASAPRPKPATAGPNPKGEPGGS